MDKVSDTLIEEPEQSPVAFDHNPDSHFHTGFEDCINGFKRWRLWIYMAYADIRRRYRRTLIGPFWSTMSVTLFIASMGILFSTLWHRDMSHYLPFFAAGYVVWLFFSTTLIESCTTFTAVEGHIKQLACPYGFYAFLVVARNTIVFFHQLVVFLVVAFIFHVPITPYTWLAIPGFLLLALNCSWLAIVLGLLCARLRDIQQIIVSLLQIAMFITPVFWSESQLGTGKIAWLTINLNPIYHFVSVVRYPLLGQHAHLLSWIVNITVLVVGWIFALSCLGRYYNKLIYWL